MAERKYHRMKDIVYDLEMLSEYTGIEFDDLGRAFDQCIKNHTAEKSMSLVTLSAIMAIDWDNIETKRKRVALNRVALETGYDAIFLKKQYDECIEDGQSPDEAFDLVSGVSYEYDW